MEEQKKIIKKQINNIIHELYIKSTDPNHTVEEFIEANNEIVKLWLILQELEIKENNNGNK